MICNFFGKIFGGSKISCTFAPLVPAEPLNNA